jgi:YesN/AraC family two-component response regulator
LAPDIAIIDISMPGLTGLEILAIANSERSFHAPGLFHRIG